MTLKTALETAYTRLAKLNLPIDTRWSEAEILLAHTLKRERTWLIAHGEDELPPSKEGAFFKLITRRETHEPIAYLTGTKEFRGLSFEVNKHSLIPRPETEEMIDLVQQRFTNIDARSLIWDVGTGSGAIAVSVKHRFSNAAVIASDMSRRALTLAQKNADRLLKNSHDIQFIQGSLLTKQIQKTILEKNPQTLVVLANLPYLPLSDKQVLAKDVVDFEPHQALFTQNEGNALIIKLLTQLRGFLTQHPLTWHGFFEFDPPQAHTLKKHAHELFPKAHLTIHTDTCGRERFLEIQG